MKNSILEVKNLNLSALNGKNSTQILRNVSFELEYGARIGLVGHSGAGKSMTMSVITGSTEKNMIIDGSVLFGIDADKVDILQMNEKQRRKFCSQNVAIVPQDSINALNPYRCVRDQVIETIRFHKRLSRAQANEQFEDLMKSIDIDSNISKKYPYQFSGGMRQRIAIAMALESNAKILIADEPTTALDAINQLKLIEFINAICSQREIALIYISHNLSLIANICEQVLIMKGGEIIESGKMEDVFSSPKERFTKELIEGTRKLYENEQHREK